MKKRVLSILALTALFLPNEPGQTPRENTSATTTAFRPAATPLPSTKQVSDDTPKPHAYHKEPPKGPLPNTLDPERFRNKPSAFFAYTIAAKIHKLLYQIPCYCPCDKDQGHESLLDCFVGDHGVACPTCQKEVIYCYRQSHAGKTVQEIRDGIAKGEAWKIDLKR